MNRPRTAVPALVAPLAAAMLAASLSPPAAGAAPALTAQTQAAAAGTRSAHDLFLHFNGNTGATPNLASSGSAEVSTTIAAADGGTVVAVRHRRAGRAARFERFDADPPAAVAVLVVRPTADDDPFAPGYGAFSFGAAFRLDVRSQGSAADNGNNLVQRGLYDDDAQYKLQLDDRRISCRVTGSQGTVVVKAAVPVRTRRWHRGRCTRVGDRVTLRLVEHTPEGFVRHRWSRRGNIGALEFSGAPPLSVGGKVTSTGEVLKSSSDQFNGRVDNVFFRRLDG